MDKLRRQSMDITAPRARAQSSDPVKLSRKNFIFLGVGLLVIVAMIVAAMVYQQRHNQAIATDRYQVVYLVTGQIYFGKLQNTTGTYLTLKDVYTVQNEADPSAPDSNVSSQSKIIKVSQQVYGPENSMAIRADQVQFWQNLRSDSKVANAIKTAPQP
ncbi:MAG TPA: hypothetical protein VFM68_02440 [Candidatus Saccharimonadales bacterium]|nr:hypothetical protein [Candidatus Saccharimonadales bacterium]